MTEEAIRRFEYARGYSAAIRDMAEEDVVVLQLKVANLERELEVACVAAASLHQTIEELEQIVVNQQTALQQKVA